MTSPSHQTAVVTGAGSGIGRAIALTLARHRWRVALVGRRADALRETIALAATKHDALAAFPCDIGSAAAVVAMAGAVLARFGPIDALINAAGTNTPRRGLAELDHGEYKRIIATNLDGAFHCVQQFLPGMRQRRCGTIININSEAGIRGSAKSGAAYVVSKFGLRGLTQTINFEERVHGIRACGIYPGDVDTPLLQRRAVVPGPDARAQMMQPEDIAACVWLALSLPARATVEELVVRPTATP